jgi:uncharacterized protein (TIGR02300 family)
MSKSATAKSLGIKRTCPSCSTKFYDFGKKKITCPKCKSEFDAETLEITHKLALVENKKSIKKTPPSEPETVSQETREGGEAGFFESVDDLSDDDESLSVEIVIDEEENESFD